MRILKLTLQTAQPVTLGTVGDDGNTIYTLPYIPGAAIKGAVIKRYLNHNPGVDLPHDNFGQQLFDGSIRFLQATLCREGVRLMPMPRSIYRDKARPNSATRYDLAVTEPDDKILAPAFGPDTGVWVQGKNYAVYTPGKSLFTRIQRRRNANLQKIMFRQEALDRYQFFESAVLFDKNTDADRVADLLAEGPLRLGKNRGKDTGNVEIYAQEWIESPKNWREWHDGPMQPGSPDRLTMTLLSPAILTDPLGFYATSRNAIAHTLTEALTLKPNAVKIEAAYTQATTIGGFNRKWNLPLLQMRALREGSVVVFSIASHTNLDLKKRLQELEWQGIGERRCDGYGRVAFNVHTQETVGISKTPAFEAVLFHPAQQRVLQTKLDTLNKNDEAYGLLRRIVRANVHAELDRKLRNKLKTTLQGLNPGKDVRQSQLGLLRAHVERALERGPAGLADLQTFIEHQAKRATGQPLYDGIKINNLKLGAWIAARLNEVTQSEAIEKTWDLSTLSNNGIGPVTPDLDENTRYRLSLQWVLGVVKGLARKLKEKNP